MDFDAHFESALARLRRDGSYRDFATLERIVGEFPRAVLHRGDEQKTVTVWCSNDYLGMGQHPDVLAAMKAAIDSCGAGAGGTRNISGTTVYHVRLEEELAKLHGKEAALVFTSGFNANETALSTLQKVVAGCVTFSDQLNHASMIDGIRHGGGPKRIFRHNDTAHLAELLEAEPPETPKIIAFESIHSMEADPDTTQAAGALTAANDKAVLQPRPDLLLRQRHAQHVTRRQLLHHAPARRHQPDRVFEREHTRQRRRRELAHAVSDQAVQWAASL